MSCTFDEDAYRNQQLNEYLEGRDDEISNCCSAWFLEDSDICSECLEHAISIADERCNYEGER
ncbi:MAG: hypothetical protein GQ570_08465 [Helicobacteraceae bacterium]|nr:hypothetical protein [Helicobacteraceae bacterium]